MSSPPHTERSLIDSAASGACGAGRFVPEALDLLKRQAAFAEVWRAGVARDRAALARQADSGVLTAAFSSDLAVFLLGNYLIVEPALEFIVTAARRSLLFAFTQEDRPVTEPMRRLLGALALQCLLNEHAYWEDADETVWVELLGDSLILSAAGGEDAPQAHLVALFGCYRPLRALELSAAAVERLRRDPTTAALVAHAIDDPREEADIANALPDVTPIRDGTSRQVRAMYEENPYPRWFILERPVTRPCMDLVRDLSGIDLAAFGQVTAPRILVAGCGTGSNVIGVAGQFLDADITAVDLSRASLAYAKRQTTRLGLRVAYAHGDILELPAWGRTFDIVECSGVLHHMKDPLAGARALWRCVRPGGLLRMGLYSRSGRDALAPARAFIERGGYSATPEGIRRFRRDVMAAALKPDTLAPDLTSVTLLHDFYSTSMCRDLVFHVQERGYGIAEIEEMAQALGGRLMTTVLTAPFAPSPAMGLTALAELERRGGLTGFMYTVVVQKPADAA
ncbi:MAG: class I SAM-dependent methyltransferase [Rhodospirillaceae bacterium]|nr:class I SAM-dependent methyltransferase [Rhodospirillaceae bacterium]